MPNLVLFAICRNAVVDQADNTVSLMCILNGLTVSGNITEGAATIIEWAAVCIWERTDEDSEDEVFEFRLRVKLPDGTHHGEALGSFALSQGRHQSIINGPNLPLWREGLIAFELELRSLSKNTEYKQWGTFPLLVSHAKPAISVETANTG